MLKKVVFRTMLLALLAASSNLFAAEELSPETINQVVHEISEVLAEQYIFSDVGESMASTFTTRLENGDYDALSDATEFTDQLTEELRALSNDEHLFIFYSEDNVTTEQEYLDPTPEMKLQNQNMHKYFNAGVSSVGRLDGNIGYLEFSSFMDKEPTGPVLGRAMNLLQDTGGLIIDLRKNTGGMPETVALLASYFLGPDPVHVDSIYWKASDTTEEYWSTADLDGPWYGTQRPVFILNSATTFSAAEAFSYAMQAFGRAEIVGEGTRGGAHPGGMQRIADNFYLWVSNGRAINAVTGENWEGTGVSPDYPVAADAALETAHRLILPPVIEQTEYELDRQDRERHLRRLQE